MKIILRQDMEKLGKIGDVLDVAAGYGRNYLIPKKYAVEATPGNLKVVEVERLAMAKQDLREKEAATLVAKEITQHVVTMRRKAGEGGTLYGSVTALDVADYLVSHKIEVDKRKIQLDEPIKACGEYEVPIRLHREVIVPVKLVVEAESQPSPEDS